jgi:hypothetical protein
MRIPMPRSSGQVVRRGFTASADGFPDLAE